jgi:predicted RNA-binding protein YlxR (DUF448 family)
MQKPRKIPMRKCLATNESYPKKEMFRIVRTPEGNVLVDDTGKMNGRGAYLSKSKEAIEIARTKKVLDRQLEITVPSEVYQELLKRIGE